jgi:hypothetical protein
MHTQARQPPGLRVFVCARWIRRRPLAQTGRGIARAASGRLRLATPLPWRPRFPHAPSSPWLNTPSLVA